MRKGNGMEFVDIKEMEIVSHRPQINRGDIKTIPVMTKSSSATRGGTQAGAQKEIPVIYDQSPAAWHHV
jgi:hypothetical protein